MSGADEAVGTEVVVVGAGPVGSFLACLLGAAGVRVRIVEQRDHAPVRSMAIGIMPPTLFRFDALGLSDALVAAGRPVRRAVVHDAARLLGRLEFAALPGPYPFVLTLPQRRLVRTLWQRLRETERGHFETGVRATAIAQDADGVTVQMASAAGSASRQSVRGRFLVLCDGARGSLPARMGMDRPGRRYAPSFVMGDAPDRTGWESDARLFFTPAGSVESFPLPDGRRRWVALAEAAGEADDAIELVRRVRAIAGVQLSPAAVLDPSRFTPEYRLARRFRVGRAALCGDAAHVMSPIGGQGMNVGLGDAWHLAAVLTALLRGNGRLAPCFLSYEHSRRRAFRHASRRAAIGMWVGTRTGRVASRVRSVAIRHGLLRPVPIRNRLALFFSMWTIPDGSDPALETFRSKLFDGLAPPHGVEGARP